MRVSRAIRASLAGLGVGYLACLIASQWLRWASRDAELLWNVVSPLRVAAWMLTSAHAVPLVVRSSAGVSAPEAAGSIGRLSELLGGGEGLAFSFSIVLVPLTILALIGATVALAIRRAGPSSTGDVFRATAVSAVVHSAALGVASRLSSIDLVFQGTLAPDLGLGPAVGRVELGIGPRTFTALGVGALFGAAFAVAGALSSIDIRASIAPQTRVILFGWMRGLTTAVGIVAAVLALGGSFALVTGRAPSVALFALGGLLLGGNAVAAGIVGAHGLPMHVALDAGPFTGWERVDLLHFGAAGATSPKVLVLAVIVPIAAGVVAGRFCRRRTDLDARAIALRFGALWGLTLAVLALLVRVRILSSLEVGAVDLGGGSAAFDPLASLVIGAVWGAVTSFAGARAPNVVRVRAMAGVRASLGSLAAAQPTWSCERCRMPNTFDDRFCVSCGAGRA